MYVKLALHHLSLIGMFRQPLFSCACFCPTDRSPKKRQNLVVGCLLEQNLGKNIYWINLDFFAIHVMAYLCRELMPQLAQPDQHFYHDGWMLEWLSGGLELPCTYRQIMSNAIEDSRPLRQRHSDQPFAQDLRIFNSYVLEVGRVANSHSITNAMAVPATTNAQTQTILNRIAPMPASRNATPATRNSGAVIMQ
jgi:hypothetical protein